MNTVDQNNVGALATSLQRRAADPEASVWVAASAGTGKTKVLTDRILNLLLAGAKPSKILALTFTKAAAAEMANRVSTTLSAWAIFEDADLEADLEKLLGRKANPDQQIRARQLFTMVLETPGGMRVQTIHSFCQSLLGRFPIEASVPPNFELLDDLSSERLMRQARENILVQGFTHPNSTIATQLDVLSRHLTEDNFISIIQSMLSERGRIQRLLRHYEGVDGWISNLRDEFDLGASESAEALDKWFCDEQNFNRKALEELAQAAELAGGVTNTQLQQGMSAWLTSSDKDRAKCIEDYLLVWLTQKLEARSGRSSFTKAVMDPNPHFIDTREVETQRCLRYIERRNAIGVFEANAALMRLVDLMLDSYHTAKSANAKLDYDDLILKARQLLEASDTAAQWVLFKLDEGLSHILVDEAQDTNADQWEVILLLAKEFFSGLGQEEEQARTIFVVGDRKQSIYSFQRADPKVFDKMRDEISRMVKTASAKWDEVPLNISFRSTSAILDLTDKTLETENQREGLMAPDEPEWRPHQAFRSKEFGRAVLWPLVEKTPRDEEVEQPIVNPAAELSHRIAERIRVWTQDGGDQSQGPVKPQDILILLHNRQPLADLLVKALQDANVPVAGLDRMQLTNQLVVQDLLMLGDFALYPDDDLALACILRSPFCNFSEQDLYDVSINRQGASIWSSLRDRAHKHKACDEALEFLIKVLAIAERSPAFEFYAAILSEFKQKPKMIARLGAQISDPVQEFLNRAIAFESEGPSSLQGFLHWMRKTETQIKRDAESKAEDDLGAVRIMTVHGAKGLQAPVVILPDTTRTKKNSFNKDPMWDTGIGVSLKNTNQTDTCFWLPRSDMANAKLEALQEKLKIADLEERRRLLYVALTRAENNLHVMGHFTGKEIKDECWYSQISKGFFALAPEIVEVDNTEVQIYETGTISPSKPQAKASKVPNLPAKPAEQNEFLFSRVEKEALPTKPLTPSRLDEDLSDKTVNPELVNPPLIGPTKDTDQAQRRFQRGLVTHALLQHLPEIEYGQRLEAMDNFLSNQRPQLQSSIQEAICSEVQAVFDHPEAGVLFGPESQAEVPLVGQVGDRGVLGRVDRLIVLEDRILIIDFKTNRPPPKSADAVPVIYIKQMDYYSELLSALYVDRKVQRFLLWTDGCHLMEV